MPRVLLIIPCFRERDRLPTFLPALCEALSAVPGVRVRVVDDGSGAEQQAWLQEYVDRLRGQFPHLEPAQLNPANRGKGGAIYSGWEQPGPADLLGFVDADGAVPAREVVRLLHMADNESALYAVRTGQDGTTVRRALHRRIAGSVFRKLVRRLFAFPLPDTQCGFKLIPAAAFHTLRPQLKEERFTFDVELTWHLLHHGTPIRHIPIDWTESPGSRLRPGSVLTMHRSLRALRAHLGDWRKPA